MKSFIGIEAIVAWQLLQWQDGGLLHESGFNYNNGLALESLSAEDLLSLLINVRKRLGEMGCSEEFLMTQAAKQEPDRLFIDREYSIRLGSEMGPEIKLRPLVKTVFIFFLKHPEGILLKERAEYESELRRIYAIIAPNVSSEDRTERIHRLVSIEDNSFSEKCSVLNATLDRLIQQPLAEGYKVRGSNGFPRRIPLSPMLVTWA